MLEYEKFQSKERVKEILTNMRFLSEGLSREEDSVIEAYLCRQALFLSFELTNELLLLDRENEETTCTCQGKTKIQKGNTVKLPGKPNEERNRKRAERRAKKSAEEQEPTTEPAPRAETANEVEPSQNMETVEATKK